MTQYLPKKDAPIVSNLRFRFDVWLALAVAGLLLMGMMVVYSSSFDLAFRSGLTNHDHAFYFRRQFFALGVGLTGIVVIMQFDYHFFRHFSVVIMGSTLLMLFLVLLIGNENFGATRGLFNNSIQPSELAKLAMILYVSHWLSTKGDRVKSIQYGLLPFALMVGSVGVFIVRQPDLSTTLLITLTSFSLFFLAGADFKQFVLAIIVVACVFFIFTLIYDHAGARIDAWQEALVDPNNAPYQIKLAVVSLGSGHIFGRGLGNGAIKYIMPAAHTDATFAVWGEELGFFGCMMIILSFALLAWRGFVAARNARDMYGFLLAMGVTCWISFQALMNMAVITSTIPFTGIPLPFMGYGGTSLVITLLGVGVLLNVSRDAVIGKTLKQSRSALESVREDDDLRRGDGGTRVPRPRRRPRVAMPQTDE